MMPAQKAKSAPAKSVRTRQLKDPFISTQEMASAVTVIQIASLRRLVAKPQTMGKVPESAIRIPQLNNGSKLSFWRKLLNILYGFKYVNTGSLVFGAKLGGVWVVFVGDGFLFAKLYVKYQILGWFDFQFIQFK